MLKKIKICTKCGENKPETSFRKRKCRRGNKQYVFRQGCCNACEYSLRKEFHLTWRKSARGAFLRKQNTKNFRSNYAKYTLHSLKMRASRKGLKFNLDESDLKLPKKCPVLGIKLQRNGGKARDNSPSVDRINPLKGYIKGNVAIISNRANLLKNNASLAELESILAYVKSKLAASRGGRQPI